MAHKTVNIAFQHDLLRSIDRLAQSESRSRSELLREAAREYIQKKDRWKNIFKMGSRLSKSRKLTEEDISKEIAAYRKNKVK